MKPDWVVCLLLAGSCGVLAWGDQKPIIGHVGPRGAIVRAGPGLEYYGTESLEPGATVEIYRQGPDGWLGIRPPEGAFSWVRADAVSWSAPGDVGLVRADGTISWVGSHLGRVAHHVWQVRLKSGERLWVLGRQEVSLHEGEPAGNFLKVAPPSGEFRWIHRSDLKTVEAVGLVAGMDAGRQTGKLDGAVAPVQHQEPSSDGTARLAWLELEVARRMARPASQWHFKDLEEPLIALASSAEGPIARRASQLLSAIRHYHVLASADPPAPESHRDQAVVAASFRQQASSGKETVSVDVASDTAPSPASWAGTGWLVPVHTTRENVPPFALLDADGQPKAYLWPLPAWNLSAYSKDKVRVAGKPAGQPIAGVPVIQVQSIHRVDPLVLSWPSLSQLLDRISRRRLPSGAEASRAAVKNASDSSELADGTVVPSRRTEGPRLARDRRRR